MLGEEQEGERSDRGWILREEQSMREDEGRWWLVTDGSHLGRGNEKEAGFVYSVQTDYLLQDRIQDLRKRKDLGATF